MAAAFEKWAALLGATAAYGMGGMGANLQLLENQPLFPRGVGQASEGLLPYQSESGGKEVVISLLRTVTGVEKVRIHS